MKISLSKILKLYQLGLALESVYDELTSLRPGQGTTIPRTVIKLGSREYETEPFSATRRK